MANSVRDGEIPFDGTSTLREFVAERVHLYVQTKLTDFPGLAQNARFNVVMHQVDGMIAQMTSWCLAGRIPSDSRVESVEWPDGPWQSWKDKYAPAWLLRLSPVKKVHRNFTVVLNHYFVCPHLATDPQQEHVRFMALGTPLASWMRSSR